MLNEDTIKEIYHDLAPKLTNYLAAGGLDHASACDITQECFIRLWKKRETIKDSESASGFLFVAAKNLKIDRYRRNKFIVFQEALHEESSGCTEQPANESDLVYLRKRLSQALAELPETLREAYTLFHIANCSIRETARITGAAESNVKVRIHRAREKLSLLLQDLQ
jgi:RNA polymerase sigma-70 factor (ECF subfamily)